MPVSADEISWVYRLMLGREPASSELDTWYSVASVDELRRLCLDSAEFRGVMSRVGITPASAPAPRLSQDLAPASVDWQTDPHTEATLLDHVTRTWTALGRERPHWSVLSSDAFLPEHIEANERAFYASGAGDVRRIASVLKRHGRTPGDLPRMVEYGCGVGRVTPHLAESFASVTACDISESHLGMARETVARSGRGNVRFALARAPDFGLHEPFDLWFSYIVLQHNPPPVMAMVLRRALAMLAPGGMAIFQVPTYALGYHFALQSYLAKPTETGTIEVHCLPQSVVFQLVHEAGCVPLEVREDTAMGPPSAWLSNNFVVHKPR